MDNFFIHFVLCNITIGLFVLILLCMKRRFHCLFRFCQFHFLHYQRKCRICSTLLHILATQSIPQILRNIHPHPQIKSMITQSPCVHSFQSIFLPFFVWSGESACSLCYSLLCVPLYYCTICAAQQTLCRTNAYTPSIWHVFPNYSFANPSHCILHP